MQYTAKDKGMKMGGGGFPLVEVGGEVDDGGKVDDGGGGEKTGGSGEWWMMVGVYWGYLIVQRKREN